MPHAGAPSSAIDAGSSRRTMRPSWLAGLAIVVLGIRAIVTGVFGAVGVDGHKGVGATAKIERVGGNGDHPVVTLMTSDGRKGTAELRDAARDHKSSGPISVAYDPSKVYDPNALGGVRELPWRWPAWPLSPSAGG